MKEYDLIIVGGGAAGMLCAINSKRSGVNNVLVIEKDIILGGALNIGDYNISSNRVITGKEYNEELLKEYEELNIDTYFNTLVLNINDLGNIICISPERGVEELAAKKIILANGAKEKGRNALNMPGDRCAGIFTIGNAKKILNMDNIILGREVIIYGSENLNTISKILKEKDVKIKAIICNKADNEVSNISNKIYEGFEITSILGKDRVSSVIISNNKEEQEIKCDTVILAHEMLCDGLVSFRSNIALNPKTTGPKLNDNFETSRPNIFACGNGIYIHNNIEELETEAEKLISYIE